MPTPTSPFAFHNSRAAKLLLTTESLKTRVPAVAGYYPMEQEDLILYYNTLVVRVAEYEAAVRTLGEKRINIEAITTAKRNYLLLLDIILTTFNGQKIADIKHSLLEVHQIYLQETEKCKVYKNLSQTAKNMFSTDNPLHLPPEIITQILIADPFTSEEVKEEAEQVSQLWDFPCERDTRYWEQLIAVLKEKTRGTSLFPAVEGLATHYSLSGTAYINLHRKLAIRILNFIDFPKTADRPKLINDSQKVSSNVYTIVLSTPVCTDPFLLAFSMTTAVAAILGGALLVVCSAVAISHALPLLAIGATMAALGLSLLLAAVVMHALFQGKKAGKEQAAQAIEIKPDQLDTYIAQKQSSQPTPGWQEKVTKLFSPLRACFNQKETTTFKPAASPRPPKRRGCFSMG